MKSKVRTYTHDDDGKPLEREDYTPYDIPYESTDHYYEQPKLTAREKKAIIEKESHCRVCIEQGTVRVAASVSDEGVPLCRTHGG